MSGGETKVIDIVALAGSLLFGNAVVPRSVSTSADSILRNAPAGAAMPASRVSFLFDTAGTVLRQDTVRKKRPVAVEYSEWYGRRLTVHRWASYLMLPLFAGNYVTGQQLLTYGNQAPSWALRAHGPLATGVATLFAVNTFTGGWNLWDARRDPSARTWRTVHAVLMLTADAGFTEAGILSRQAQHSDQRRRLHRTVALASIGTSVVSYVMMLPPLRRD